MSVAHLSVVRPAEDAENAFDRAQRLYNEAQAAALEQVGHLEAALDNVVSLAQSIADGGDIYPAGVRELCRRSVDDTAARRKTLEALAARRR